MASSLFTLTLSFAILGGVRCATQLPGSSPNAYANMPSGDYGTNWQSYYRVSSNLSGLNFDIGTSYAGNIGVQRPDHPNNTLFFWGFESQKESLTAAAGDRSTQPWAIWLQGGPGTASLYGLFSENGPILLNPGTQTFQKNDRAWNQLIDYFWIDQPVGVGYSTTDSNGYAVDENQVAADFVGFLTNLVKVFPSLSTRPFYLTGESYAGRYIPYIAQALFSMSNPPVILSKMVLGNPALGSNNEFKTLPTLSVIETYPQIIGYDTDVYDYFANQAHLCGLDLNLSYPQTGGNFPSINLVLGENQNLMQGDRDDENDIQRERGPRHNRRKALGDSDNDFFTEVAARHAERRADTGERVQHQKRSTGDQWKTDVAAQPDNTINSWYGCYVWDEMVDYAVNFTFPWNSSLQFDDFDIPDALQPNPIADPSSFLNSNSVRSALHAPTDKDWSLTIDYPWGSNSSGIDPSPEPMTFLTELATNATDHGVHIVIFIGNDDSISPHFGTEVTIQNTTFGGIQGFTKEPSTPWWDDNGKWAGIVHQERNWTYALIYDAGHEVAAARPVAAYTFIEEFVLGSNQTGLVQNEGTNAIVVGGENPTLQQEAIPGKLEIAFGSMTTQGTTIWPSPTRAAFASHVGQVAVTGTNSIAPSPTATGKSHSGASATKQCTGQYVFLVMSFAVVFAHAL